MREQPMARIITLSDAEARMKALSAEMATVRLVKEPSFETGVIAFRPRGEADAKLITHDDLHVVAYVIRGHGQLRAGADIRPVEAGSVCHVPPGVPHDFSACDGELLLMYTLVRASPTPLPE